MSQAKPPDVTFEGCRAWIVEVAVIALLSFLLAFFFPKAITPSSMFILAAVFQVRFYVERRFDKIERILLSLRPENGPPPVS